MQLRHALGDQLTGPSLPRRDALRREGAVDDAAHGRVPLAVFGDEVARGGELERVETCVPNEAHEKPHHAPRHRRRPLASLVHQEGEHRARGEELRVLEDEHHVFIARRAPRTGAGRPMHGRVFAQRPVVRVRIHAEFEQGRVVLRARGARPGTVRTSDAIVDVLACGAHGPCPYQRDWRVAIADVRPAAAGDLAGSGWRPAAAKHRARAARRSGVLTIGRPRARGLQRDESRRGDRRRHDVPGPRARDDGVVGVAEV